jgi:hypothetical protein
MGVNVASRGDMSGDDFMEMVIWLTERHGNVAFPYINRTAFKFYEDEPFWRRIRVIVSVTVELPDMESAIIFKLYWG